MLNKINNTEIYKDTKKGTKDTMLMHIELVISDLLLWAILC
jgi:hypothetical protein